MKGITIYTTPTCTFCKALKTFLRGKNIAFTEYDVISMPDKFEEMHRLSGGASSVPVIVFNKGERNQSVQIGFDEEMVLKTLEL